MFAEDVESAVTRTECRLLSELAEGRIVLELGAFHGRSTIALASAAEWVDTVDPSYAGRPGRDRTSVADVLRQNLIRYDVDAHVTIHVGYSTEVLPVLREASFEFLFVDAMHDRESVEQDIRLALPLLRPGASLAFHDYGVEGVCYDGVPYDFDVAAAVDAFAEHLGVGVELTETLAVVHLPHAARGAEPLPPRLTRRLRDRDRLDAGNTYPSPARPPAALFHFPRDGRIADPVR